MSGLEGLLAGRVLGDRYRIEEVIGRGGMGAVYRAVDERLGRQVAVKVVTATGGNDAESRQRLRARFQREARGAAALPHHPNVVPVYDYGTDATLGLDYIVMELLRGNDLATRLARAGAPPLAASLKILYEAARGLAVGHRAGLIHRDVKPGNIFLAETGPGEIQVRVVDFGIAKLAEDDDTAAQLTQDGRVPHSPAFAAPEQLRGLGDITAAADVFGLGAVGFTLLTGERPFSETDRNRMSLGMPVEPPSLRGRNPAVPRSVEAVLQRALAYDPADRFPDAAALAAALGDALRSLPDAPLEPYSGAAAVPVPAAPEADAERTQLFDPDDRTLLAPDTPRSGAPPAAPPTQRPMPPRREPERKRGIGGMLVWALVLVVLGAAAAWIWLDDGSRPREARFEEIPPAPDSLVVVDPDTRIEEEVDPQPEITALIHNEEGLRFYRAGDYQAAIEQFRLATELSPENPDFRYNYGLALLQAGRVEAAAEQLRRATDLDPGRAGAFFRLGEARLQLGDTAAAWTALQRAEQLASTPQERALANRRIRDIERATTPEVVRPETTQVAPPPVDTLTARVPPPRPAPAPQRADTSRPRRRLLGVPIRRDTTPRAG